MLSGFDAANSSSHVAALEVCDLEMSPKPSRKTGATSALSERLCTAALVLKVLACNPWELAADLKLGGRSKLVHAHMWHRHCEVHISPGLLGATNEKYPEPSNRDRSASPRATRVVRPLAFMQVKSLLHTSSNGHR